MLEVKRDDFDENLEDIMNSINGNIHVHSGGGGVYGKVEVK